MSVTPKPFSAAEKIRRVVFGGRPKVTSSEDINKELDKIDNAIISISNLVGMIRENWSINMQLIKDTNDGTNNIFNSQISLLKVDNALPAYVYFRGVRFDIPVGTALQYSGTFSAAIPTIPMAYLFLVANKETINFTTDPVLCGLTSSEFPQSLPSCDIVRYKGERLVYASSVASVSISGTEEIIGIIATIGATDTTSLVVDPNNANAYLPSKSFTRTVLYNAATVSELFNQFKFQLGDETMRNVSTPFTSAIGSVQTVLNNGSYIDLMLWISEYLKRKDMYQTLLNKNNTLVTGWLQTQITTLTTTINGLSTAITTILNKPDIPIGTILAYAGDISNFEASGKGKTGTPMSYFAICNGANGTQDCRGRFLVGVVNVPNTGAPSLAAEVDPANPLLPGGTNPSYSFGDKGGQSVHKLTVDELPAHNHGFNLFTSSGGPKVAPAAVSGNTLVSNTDIENTGGNQYHENKPPYLGVYYIQRIV